MQKTILQNTDVPLYSPEQRLPELTFKVFVLSVVLVSILTAANLYLALKIGTTIAASIPASICAIGIFKLFKRHNVLESNLVQTAASAGEGLASAAAFILPAILMIGYWQKFHFWETTFIMMLGGILGVFLSIPLRKVLLGMKDLPFPEGTAVGNVLRASVSGTDKIKILLQGTLVGGFISLCQTGFGLIANSLPLWFKSEKTLYGTSLGFDPVLLGAGYIIGLNVALTLFAGTVLAWFIGLPILSHFYSPTPGSNAEEAVMELWKNHIRYIGVGSMLISGFWTVIMLLKAIWKGLILTFQKIQKDRKESLFIKIPRTEQDIPLNYLFAGLFLISVFLFIGLIYLFEQSGLLSHSSGILGFSLLGVIYIITFGFFSAVVSGYVVGLIGSTNSPVSGIFIINILLLCLIFFYTLGFNFNLSLPDAPKTLAALLIFILTVVGSAAVITNENIQDLKAGQMIGATPWKQQLMMLIGVCLASLLIAPVLQLLLEAYGIGGISPTRPGIDPSQMLLAPQAGLLSSLVQGAIAHNLPWNMMLIGVAIGVVCIILDEILKRKSAYRLTPLAVGLGIYLPPDVITPLLLGGFLSYLVQRKNSSQQSSEKESFDWGVLLACGLVAGSALMGVILSIPFVLKGSSNALRLVGESFTLYGQFLAVGVTVLMMLWVYRTAIKKN